MRSISTAPWSLHADTYGRTLAPTSQLPTPDQQTQPTRSGRWWCGVEAEMLTHGVGLERVPPQPGQSDVIAPVHQQVRVFEHLYRFCDRARIGISEQCHPRISTNRRTDRLAIRACPTPRRDGCHCAPFRHRRTRRIRKQRQDRRRNFGGWHREPPRLVAGHTRIETRGERSHVRRAAPPCGIEQTLTLQKHRPPASV
jgi:hypothetical protein